MPRSARLAALAVSAWVTACGREHLQAARATTTRAAGLGACQVVISPVHCRYAPGEAAGRGAYLASPGHRGLDVDHDHVPAVCLVHRQESARP